MGEGVGEASAHSYHTFEDVVHRQKCASTLSPGLSTTGVRRGIYSGNQLNMPCSIVIITQMMTKRKRPEILSTIKHVESVNKIKYASLLLMSVNSHNRALKYITSSVQFKQRCGWKPVCGDRDHSLGCLERGAAGSGSFATFAGAAT